MRKLSFLAISTLVLTACGGKDGAVKGEADGTLQAQRDSLQEALANQDSLLVLVSEISAGMDEIKSLENILASTTNLTAETTDRRQKIKDDMMAIQNELNQRRQRLAELEGRLNQSNANNANLRRAISTLKGQIAEQVSTIESLRGDLASANIYIDKLTQSNDSLNATVETTLEQKNVLEEEKTALTNELNTCYYVIGSKSELKDHKIIETGFLRKTKIMPEDFEHSYFTTADKRQLVALPLHSKKAEVLTNQPSGSYVISTDSDGSKVLTITNPDRFWSTSNYLVIKID